MTDQTPDRVYNVLFLCTGNSARSVLGEAIMNALPGGKFRAYSAGSQPKGQVNPLTLHTLREMGLPTEGYRSKSWDEFAAPDAPKLDFVFTVCDDAAGETCPYWPGQPMTAHWGVPDPAAVEGTQIEIEHAFQTALRVLQRRIELFASLPVKTLDRMSLKKHLDDIGGAQAEKAEP